MNEPSMLFWRRNFNGNEQCDLNRAATLAWAKIQWCSHGAENMHEQCMLLSRGDTNITRMQTCISRCNIRKTKMTCNTCGGAVTWTMSNVLF